MRYFYDERGRYGGHGRGTGTGTGEKPRGAPKAKKPKEPKYGKYGKDRPKKPKKKTWKPKRYREDKPRPGSPDYQRPQKSTPGPWSPGWGRTAKMLSKIPKYGRGFYKLSPYGQALDLLLMLAEPMWLPAQPIELIGGGWNLLCTLPIPFYDRYREAVFSPGLSCGTGGQTTVWSQNIDHLKSWAQKGTPDGGRVRWIAFGKFTPTFLNARMRLDIQYTRPTQRARDPFSVRGRAVPTMAPLQYPWPLADPMLTPIGIPMDMPLPWPAFGPASRPGVYNNPDGSSAGYGPTPYPDEDPGGAAPPWTPNAPYVPPYVNPGGSSPTDPDEPVHNLPPGPGDKEKKLDVRGGPASNAARGIFHQMTELGDWIDAVHEALPEERQSDGGLHERMQAIADNWEEIDWPKALKNAIENYVEDKAIGGLFGAADKGWKSAGDRGYAPRGGPRRPSF